MEEPANEVTLFLVEDDDVDAMTVERCFQKQHIINSIVRAGDGVEALEMLQAGVVKQPYIILLDLNLPRMSGLEFLQVIRKDPRFKSSVIFVLTTSKNAEDVLASYLQYIAGYFTKESSDDGIQDIVKMLQTYWKIVHLPSE